MNNVRDRQTYGRTDGRHDDDANSRSYRVTVRWAKNAVKVFNYHNH